MSADPHRALLRALGRAYPGLEVLESRSEPWASVTFLGARHLFHCKAGIDLAGIEEAEFALSGHVVADISACSDGDRIRIEALTIEAH